jgi:hypothetical protein
MNRFRYQSPSAETTTNTNSKPQNTGTKYANTLCNKPSVHKVWSLILITYLLNIAQSAKHMSETSRSVKYVSDISTHVVFSESKQQCYNSAGRALGSRVKGGGWGTEGYWGIGGSYIFIYIHKHICVHIFCIYIYIPGGGGPLLIRPNNNEIKLNSHEIVPSSQGIIPNSTTTLRALCDVVARCRKRSVFLENCAPRHFRHVFCQNYFFLSRFERMGKNSW